MSYIRFQTGLRCRATGRALGIFKAVGRLEDERAVQPWFEEPMRETLVWFNDNLPVPKHDSLDPRCLFWFDQRSSEILGHVWDLVNWLRQHDVFVDWRKCEHPGKIVYQDDHQVAAIPNQRIYRVIKLR